jgi:hypothetical protein
MRKFPLELELFRICLISLERKREISRSLIYDSFVQIIHFSLKRFLRKMSTVKMRRREFFFLPYFMSFWRITYGRLESSDLVLSAGV